MIRSARSRTPQERYGRGGLAWPNAAKVELARVFAIGGYPLAKQTFADRTEDAIWAQVRKLREEGVIAPLEPAILKCDPERYVHVVACKCPKFNASGLAHRLADAIAQKRAQRPSSRGTDGQKRRVAAACVQANRRGKAPGYSAAIVPDESIRLFASTLRDLRQGPFVRLGRGPRTFVDGMRVISLFEWAQMRRAA